MRVRRRNIRISAEAHDRFSAAAAARGLRLGTLVNEALAEPLGIEPSARVLIDAPTFASAAGAVASKTGLSRADLVDGAIEAAIAAEEARRG